MRSRRLVLGLVIMALATAGCGSGNSSSRSPTASSGSSATAITRPLHIYRVGMTGKAELFHGAPNGSGDAVIAIHRGSVVCWRFAHLHGFIDATVADIQVGAKGRPGSTLVPRSTGLRVHHRGCVQPSAAAIKAIERDPAGYSVNIHSLQHPASAVKGQL